MSACLSPIRVWNQQRFLVTGNSDPLFNFVRCGNCAHCQQNKAAEYAFRAYKHFEDCLNRNGYVLFDTLTYRDIDVPRFRSIDGFSDLPKHLDYMCFSRSDVRKFLVRLRRRLVKRGYKNGAFDMFISCEYGTDDRFTHRPHYHCLFFVYADIDPLHFSSLVSSCWNKGRTDGLPYKPKSYVQGNVFRSLVVGSRRVCNYVTKYVQKSSAFEKQIEKRIKFVLQKKFGYDEKLMSSDYARKFKRDLRRQVCQFHRQSHFFGYSAIRDMSTSDIDCLFDIGFFKMPNGKPSMFYRIPICNYYLRKLCYEKITLDDGYQCWSPRYDRRYLLEKRKQSIYNQYKDNLSCRFHSVGMSIPDVEVIARYQLNERGRFCSCFNEVLTIGERLDMADLFVYASSSDKANLGQRVIANKYIGYKDNYIVDDDVIFTPIVDYCSRVQSNADLDKIIDLLESKECEVSKDVQKHFDKIQRISEIKYFR